MANTPKGPLNYTTTIEPMKSATECTTRLMYHGATGIAIMGDRGKPTGLSFQINTIHGQRTYNLPVNVEGTHKALMAAYRAGRIPHRYTEADQAERVSWRVMKDWLEAQLALIEAGVAEMPQVMLPYMVIKGHETVWDRYLETAQLALEGPKR